jgi:hypothetical protein
MYLSYWKYIRVKQGLDRSGAMNGPGNDGNYMFGNSEANQGNQATKTPEYF